MSLWNLGAKWFPALVGAARGGTVAQLCHQPGRWLSTSPRYCNQFAQRLHLFVSSWQEYPQSQEKRKHWISSAFVISRGAVINLLQASLTNLKKSHAICRLRGHLLTTSPTLLLMVEGERWRQGGILHVLHHSPAVEGFGSPELMSPSAKGGLQEFNMGGQLGSTEWKNHEKGIEAQLN